MSIVIGGNDYAVVERGDGGYWVRFENFDREYLYGDDGYPVAKFPVLLNKHDEPVDTSIMVISRFARAVGEAGFNRAPDDYGVDNYASAMSMLFSICTENAANDASDDMVVSLLRGMDKYGISLLHAYEEGVNVSDLFLLDKTRNMSQLFTVLDLLGVDWTYVSRERTDGRSTKKPGNMRSFNRLPWIPECNTANAEQKPHMSIRDYPVFTEGSIAIMKTFGIWRILDFVAGISGMDGDANGCTREQVYDTFRDILDSGNPLIADCLLNVIKHARGSVPVITGDMMTLSWLREHCTIPEDTMSDNLESGMYNELGSNADDLYFNVLQRILNNLDDVDISSLGIDSAAGHIVPNVRNMTVSGYAEWLSEHYDALLRNSDSIVDKYGISTRDIIHDHYSPLKQEMNDRIASAYLAHGLMRNWHQNEYTLSDGRIVNMPTGKLLHRFMGYLYIMYVKSHNKFKSSMMTRIMNVLRTMIDLDDESFAKLSDIRCTAYGASVIRRHANMYVQAPTWFPRMVTFNYDNSQYDIIELLENDSDATLFPMGMNRMLELLESALDNGTEGIERLTTLCRNIVINDLQYTEQDSTVSAPTQYGTAVRAARPARALYGANLYQSERQWMTNGTPITKIRVNNEKYMRSTRTSRTINLTSTPYWLPM